MFSVCMLCFGRSDDLRKSLTAITEHQRPDLEVILVDNNSEPPELIFNVWREFRDRLSITLVTRSRLPSSLAFASGRNIALAIARNSWIISLDPDCVVGPGYFDSISGAINDFDDGSGRFILAGERRFVRSADVALKAIATDAGALSRITPIRSSSNHLLLRDKRFPEMAGLPDIEHPWDYMHGCNLVYSVDMARRIGGHDETFDGFFGYEDIDFAHRMVTTRGCCCRYVAGMTVLHLEPTDDEQQPDRSARGTNRNWREIGRRIPGYHDFKLGQYTRLGIWPRGLAEG